MWSEAASVSEGLFSRSRAAALLHGGVGLAVGRAAGVIEEAAQPLGRQVGWAARGPRLSIRLRLFTRAGRAAA